MVDFNSKIIGFLIIIIGFIFSIIVVLFIELFNNYLLIVIVIISSIIGVGIALTQLKDDTRFIGKIKLQEVVHGKNYYDYIEEGRNEVSLSSEYFDADKLGIQLVTEDIYRYYTAFYVLIEFNNKSIGTTISNVELELLNGETKDMFILDRIQINDEGWKNCNNTNFAENVQANSTLKLSFRFLSKKYYDNDKVLIKFKLNHTFGHYKKNYYSKLIKDRSQLKWIKGSDTSTKLGAVLAPF